MKAIVKKERAPGITVADVEKPVIGDSEMLVKVQAGSLCGSDIHVYEWTPGYEWISIPVILGHEFAGDVVEVGKDFDAAAVGDRVTVYPFLPCGNCPACRTGKGDFCEKRTLLGLTAEGGFAEYVRVGSTAKVFKIPDGMSYDAAALIEPLTVAMHAVDISDLKLGHKVAVLGPGPIGLLTLMSVRAGGAGFVMMTGTSEDEGRFKIAERLGADELIKVDEQDPVARVRELTGDGLDIVYEATGYHGAIQQALGDAKTRRNACHRRNPFETRGIQPDDVRSRQKEDHRLLCVRDGYLGSGDDDAGRGETASGGDRHAQNAV